MSRTKWLAVATTANPMASGDATAKRRTAKCAVVAKQDDADDDVPAEVQAGEGRVLVRQPWRLERAICVRLLGDGVHQAEIEHPRWRHGEEGEEEEPDRAGDDESVAEELVAVAPVEEENDRGAEDHGPVTPDVDPVREHDQDVVSRDRRLKLVLPVDVPPVLDVDDPLSIRKRDLRASCREVADEEVGEYRGEDEPHLPKEASLLQRCDRHRLERRCEDVEPHPRGR